MKYFYLLLLAVLPVACFSQDNYVPAHIVKNGGQQLNGYVNDNFGEFTPDYISFRTAVADRSTQTLSPEQLTSFKIEGKVNYVSYHGRISMDKNRYPMLAPSLDTTTSIKSIFARVIYTGTHINLYAQSDELKTRYFIAEGNGALQELKYYFYFKDDTRENKEVATYKGQLTLLAQKYNNADNYMMKKLDESTFQENDLKKVVELIDKQQSAADPYATKFFIGLQADYLTYKFDGFSPFNQSSYSGIAPQINFGLDYFRSNLKSNFTIRVEVSIWTIKPRFNAMAPQGFNDILAPVKYSFDQYGATLTPQIIYNIAQLNKNNFFVGFGVPVTYTTYQKNVTDAERVQSPYNFERFNVGLAAKAGVLINQRTDVALTYSFPRSYSSLSLLALNASGIGIGVHYRL